VYTNHAAERALERFGLVLNLEVASQLIKIIKETKPEYDALDGINTYRITYNGRKYRICYDVYKNLIITVLPAKIDNKEMRKVKKRVQSHYGER
jgi:hypothetical protein